MRLFVTIPYMVPKRYKIKSWVKFNIPIYKSPADELPYDILNSCKYFNGVKIDNKWIKIGDDIYIPIFVENKKIVKSSPYEEELKTSKFNDNNLYQILH